MTKLHAVSVGMNKFCGPAVLSILTGKSTDECARVISSINGQYRVEGVQLNDLLRAADKLGFDQKAYDASGSLYMTLTRLVNDDGMYIVTVPNHFVAIEVSEKKIYFCDNHTKEPMPAASSARMLQKVLGVHKVIKRPPPKITFAETIVEVRVYHRVEYDDPEFNTIKQVDYKQFTKDLELINYISTLTFERELDK